MPPRIPIPSLSALPLRPRIAQSTGLQYLRQAFSTSAVASNWLLPKAGANKKDRKGRPRVPTGGSMRGTTVVWGDYGLRLATHDRRMSALQLKNGEEAIRKRLRGMTYRLYTRISANIGVYTSGNEVRMGKGKVSRSPVVGLINHNVDPARPWDLQSHGQFA